MGASSSDLHHSLSRLPSLKNKPVEFKLELAQFVSLVSVDTPLPVKVDNRLFPLCLGLLISESQQKNSLDLHLILQAIQRMFKIRNFYEESPKHDLRPFVDGLKSNDETVILSTLNCVSMMLNCRVTPEPSKEKEFNKTAREAAESAVKFAFFQNGGYDALCGLLIKYGKAKEYVGILAKVLDILSLDLVDHVNTTRFHILQRIVAKLTPHTQLILDLTVIAQQHQIRAFTIILLSGLMLHGPLKFCRQVQDRVLRDGYLVYYMLFAIDWKGLDSQSDFISKWYHKSLCPLSRNLIGLLCSGHDNNKAAVLNVIPQALQGQLEDPIHKTGKIATGKKDQKEAVTQTLFYHFQTNAVQRINCDPLFSNLDDEYKLPHFVWTHRMKGEMVKGLLDELRNFQLQRDVNPSQSWNWEALEIAHPYLEKYCRVGNFYVSILIPVLQGPKNSYPLQPDLLHPLMAALFQRAVIEDDPSWKLGCLHAIAVLYERYPEHFKELLLIPYFIYILDPLRSNPTWRDHILRFLQLVLKEPINAKRFVTFGGTPHLLYYVNSIHTIATPKALEQPLEPLPFLEQPPQAQLSSFGPKKSKAEKKTEDGEDMDGGDDNDGDTKDGDVDGDENGEEKGAAEESHKEVKENATANGSSTPSDEKSDRSSLSSDKNKRSAPSLTASGVPTAPPPGKAVEGAVEIPNDDGKSKGKKTDGPPAPTLKVYKRERTEEEAKWESNDEKENLAGVLPVELQPEEVCARSIRLLRIISIGSSKLRRSLGTLTVVSALSRMLLCPILEIREDALKLLIDVLRSNLNLVPQLASTGFFIFAISAMQHSFSDQLVELINNTHLKQSIEYSPKGTSVLAPYFPSSLLKILMEQGAAGLRGTLEGDVVLSPEIIWNREMRDELFDAVDKVVDEFKKKLKKDPQTPFDLKAMKPIQFGSLQSELNVGGVYLRPLNEMGQKDLQSVRLKNPSQFVGELLKCLNSRKFTGQQLLQLLLSLAITVHRYGGELPECRSFDGFPLLLACLDPSSESSAVLLGKHKEFESDEFRSEMLEKACQVLNALLLIEGENASKCFDSKGLSSISSVLQTLISLPTESESAMNLSEISVQSAMVHLLACIRLMSRSHPPAVKHLESDIKGIRSILSLLSPPLVFMFPEIAIASEQLFTSIIKSERVQELFIRSGGFVDLVGIVAFHNEMFEEAKMREKDSLATTSGESDDAERANLTLQVRLSGLSILSILYSFAQSKSNERIVKLFNVCFPSDFCEALLQNQLDAALKFCDSQWSTEKKSILMKYMAAQKKDIEMKKEWTEWIEDRISFNHGA